MTQVVQAACPGCQQVLRIPREWVEQAMRCKHCGLIFQARARAIPVQQPPRPAALTPTRVPVAQPVNLARTPLPPSRKLPQASPAVPVAVGVAAPPTAVPASSPFAQLESSSPQCPAPAAPRRPRGSGWLGALLALCILGVAVGLTVVAWSHLSRITDTLQQVVRLPEKREARAETPARQPAEAAPPKPVDTAPAKIEKPPVKPPEKTSPKPEGPQRPVTPPVKPPKQPEPPVVRPVNEPPATGKFPRRALLLSVSNYLYFNPVSYGSFSTQQIDVHNLANQLNKGLEIPLDQVVELSDATPAPGGKRGKGARVGAVAPVKSVIEQTVTDFLTTSRPQDRILVLFIGHAVEMDGEVFLVPIEGERDNKESLLPLKWLYDKLAACRARQKILIMDVCRFDPSRGFERPGSGGPDAKVEGAMTAKIDEALKNPPPGVQLWSSCVAEQQSLEYENTGVFLEGLYRLSARGIDGMSQRRDGSIPIERLVEPVNKWMADKLGPYKKTQTSRLVGKEPEEGAPYDPAEPLPGKVVPKAVVAGADAADVNQVRDLLGEIDLPPIKIGKDETPLRAEGMPPFPARVLDAYKESGNADTELRKTLKAAVQVLAKVPSVNLKETWDYPADENRQKVMITDHQKKEVAGIMRELDEAMADLKKAATPEARAKEPRRWQAHGDFIMARLDEELAYLNEYQGLLGQMKKELPAIDRKVQNGWRVASQLSLSDSTAKKLAGEAKKILERIAKDYPNTPWQVLAKRDRMTALGMEWQAVRLDQR
jgi:hypothetical protein